MASLASDLREWFLLRDAESRATGMAAAHSTFHGLVHRAHQKREAAEALWAYGARAEALVLARTALELTRTALDVEGAPVVTQERRAAADELLERPVPELEGDLRAEHERQFEKLVDLQNKLDEALLPVALDKVDRRRVRVVRIGGVVLLVLTAIVAAVWLARRPVQLKAEASASNGPRFPPQLATDGADATEWQLPDLAPGWIDLAPLKPRPFTRLKLLNGKGGGNPDRAVLDADVEVWSQGKLIKTLPVNLGPFSLKPEWRRIELGTGSAPVEKVRIVVKTWAGQGAALAEAVLE